MQNIKKSLDNSFEKLQVTLPIFLLAETINKASGGETIDGQYSETDLLIN